MKTLMKLGWILVVLLLLATPASAAETAAGVEYFVATNGNDSNSGTLAAPFRTIQKCANVAQAGDTCMIRAGMYREVVTPARSGSAGAPITFRAYPGEVVTISGAEVLTGGWTDVGNGVYRTPMPWHFNVRNRNINQLTNDQIFWNGAMLPEARWPNIPWERVTRTTTADYARADWATYNNQHSATYGTSALSSVPNGTFNGARISFAPGWLTVHTTCDVSTQTTSAVTLVCNPDEDGGAGLRTVLDAPGERLGPAVGNRFFLWGTLAALDAPGEWYHDTAAGMLYVKPPNGQHPSGATIEARRQAWVFDLRGKSYIVLDGVNLFAGTLRYDGNTHHTTVQNIDLRYAWHVQQLPPLWLSRGTKAIDMQGYDNVIRDSYLGQSAMTMVMLGGVRNQIINNVVADAVYLGGVGTAVEGSEGDSANPGGSDGNWFTQNTVLDTGRMAVMAHSGLNVTYNDMYRTHLLITDLGAIYSWGIDGRNATIAYNFIHDITAERNEALGYYGGHGIFLDDDTFNYHVYRNVIWNTSAPGLAFYGTNGRATGLPEGTPSNRIIEHNTVLGTIFASIKTNFRGAPQTLSGTIIRNNVAEYTWFNTSAALTQSHNYVGDGLYSDPGQQNFAPVSFSPLMNAGGAFGGVAQQAPMAPVGVPDIGALENGRWPFVAGAVLRPRDVAGLQWACVQNVSGTIDCTVTGLPMGRKLPGDVALRVGATGPVSGACWTAMNYTTSMGTGRCTGIDPGGQGGTQALQVRIAGVWYATGVMLELGSSTPVVTGMYPTQGPSVGGTAITLNGSRFATGLTGYSRPVTVQNTSGAPLYDYATAVTFDSAALIGAGKMQVGCRDMRFYDANQAALSYWVASGCGTAQTRVWVKMPFLPPGATTITMNYGHPGRGAVSNASGVFVFYDDFQDGVVGPQWRLDNVTWAQLRETGGQMRITGSTTAGVQHRSVGFTLRMDQINEPTQFAIDSEMTVVSGPATAKVFIGTWDLSLYGGAASKLIGYYSSGWQQLGTSTMGTTSTTTHQFSMAYTLSGSSWVVRWLENGNVTDVRATRTVGGPNAGGFQYSPASVSAFDVQFDNVRVRPYVYPEPVATVGAEQAVGMRVDLCDGATCKPCANVEVLNAGQLTCSLPSFPVGTVADIVIYNPDGSSTTLPDAVTYVTTYQVFLPVAARP